MSWGSLSGISSWFGSGSSSSSSYSSSQDTVKASEEAKNSFHDTIDAMNARQEASNVQLEREIRDLTSGYAEKLRRELSQEGRQDLVKEIDNHFASQEK